MTSKNNKNKAQLIKMEGSFIAKTKRMLAGILKEGRRSLKD